MKKTIFCLLCILTLCFLTACQAPCAHVDSDDDGMCDLPRCYTPYYDGIDTICAHQDRNKDGKCDICKGTAAYTREGEYIYFGEYPQTLQTNSKMTYSDTPNEKGYYKGLDGYDYAKVVAAPNGEYYTFSSGHYVEAEKEYYFRVEPIRWRIVTTDHSTALLLCDSIIANMAFDEYTNDYEESDVRAWLCDTFYETAFSELQKSVIQLTLVDNSAATTASSANPYVCNNTEDYIFLLSYADVTNEAYGLDTVARQLRPSDFALASGAFMNLSANCYGCGTWWLRSPYNNSKYAARCVYRDGRVYGGSYGDIASAFFGVVPALVINLK